jgi:ribonuclease P protein component
VTRNRARRLVREAARLLHPRLSAGYDLVFVVRRAFVGQPFLSVQRIVEELCNQAGLVLMENGGV